MIFASLLSLNQQQPKPKPIPISNVKQSTNPIPIKSTTGTCANKLSNSADHASESNEHKTNLVQCGSVAADADADESPSDAADDVCARIEKKKAELSDKKQEIEHLKKVEIQVRKQVQESKEEETMLLAVQASSADCVRVCQLQVFALETKLYKLRRSIIHLDDQWKNSQTKLNGSEEMKELTLLVAPKRTKPDRTKLLSNLKWLRREFARVIRIKEQQEFKTRQDRRMYVSACHDLAKEIEKLERTHEKLSANVQRLTAIKDQLYKEWLRQNRRVKRRRVQLHKPNAQTSVLIQTFTNDSSHQNRSDICVHQFWCFCLFLPCVQSC